MLLRFGLACRLISLSGPRLTFSGLPWESPTLPIITDCYQLSVRFGRAGFPDLRRSRYPVSGEDSAPRTGERRLSHHFFVHNTWDCGVLSWVWGPLTRLYGTQLGPRGLFRRVRSLWLEIFKTIEGLAEARLKSRLKFLAHRFGHM